MAGDAPPATVRLPPDGCGAFNGQSGAAADADGGDAQRAQVAQHQGAATDRCRARVSRRAGKVKYAATGLEQAQRSALFWIVPPNVLEPLLLPTVKMGVPPATVSTVPVPKRPLMAALYVFRSNVPPPSVMLPELAIWLAPPSCRVEPAATLAMADAAMPLLWLRMTAPLPTLSARLELAAAPARVTMPPPPVASMPPVPVKVPLKIEVPLVMTSPPEKLMLAFSAVMLCSVPAEKLKMKLALLVPVFMKLLLVPVEMKLPPMLSTPPVRLMVAVPQSTPMVMGPPRVRLAGGTGGAKVQRAALDC